MPLLCEAEHDVTLAPFVHISIFMLRTVRRWGERVNCFDRAGSPWDYPPRH